MFCAGRAGLRFSRRLADWRQNQLPTSLLEHSLHRRRKIQNEVKTIGDPLRLRRPERRALGIDATPIPGDRHDFRMVPEPFGEAVSGSIRQKINNAVRVQIDQNRSILLAFAPSPIIKSQVLHGKGGCFRRIFPNAT